MKAFFAIFSLFFAGSAQALDPNAGNSAVLTAAPTTAAGRVENGMGGRGLASVNSARAQKNAAICSTIAPGQHFMVKNSIRDWDDKIATVTDKYEDCTVHVRLPDGKRAVVRGKNLSATLAREVKCLEFHGSQVCKGDKVFYPQRTSSMDLPMAPVSMLFEHGVIQIKDGADFVFRVDQVGKPTNCSPDKNVCVGDYVFAEGFKIDRKFNFEGPVLNAFTNGVVVVESDKLWKFPIAEHAVKKRVATEDGSQDPSVITTRGSRGKDLPYHVMPEIEPGDPGLADRFESAK